MQHHSFFKVVKYDIQKPSACCTTLFCCKFWVDVSRFSPCVIDLLRKKNICCGLKKDFAKSRAHWSTLSNKLWLCSLFFIKLTSCHATNAAILDPHQASQPISTLHFFNLQQNVLLCNKLIMQGEIAKHINPKLATKQCCRTS